MLKKRIFAATTAILALCFAGAAADAAELFTLKSTTFADGKIMPKKVANSAPTHRTIRTASAITCHRNCPGATFRTAAKASFC